MNASDKGAPFVRREPENGPFAVPAVTNADLTAVQAGYLDAVAVREAQRALDPGRRRTSWLISGRSYTHRYYLTDCWEYPEYATTECSLNAT